MYKQEHPVALLLQWQASDKHLPYKHKDIMQTIDDVVQHLSDLQAAAVDLQTDDVVAFSEKVDVAQKKVSSVQVTLDEQTAASTWKQQQSR